MKYVILLLALSGCAIPSYTVRNVKVFDRQVDTHMTQKQVEDLIDYTFSFPGWSELLFEHVNIKSSEDQRQFFNEVFEGWHFVFTSNWHGVMLEDGRIALVDGLTIAKDKVIFLKVYPCYGHSAILHEVAHAIRNHLGYAEDRKHEDYEFWMVIGWIEEAMMKELCPSDYVPPTVPENLEIIE